MDIEVNRPSQPIVPVRKTNLNTAPPDPVPPRITETRPKEKQSIFPYLAGLVAFVVLLLNCFYSVASLVAYSIDKLLIKQKTADYDYSYFSGVDSFMVLYCVSSLIVGLPLLLFLLLRLHKAEKRLTWRASQKWRRIIYTFAMVVMIFSIIGSLIGTVYGLFSIYLDLSPTMSYSSSPAPDKGTQYLSVALTGLSSAALFILGLLTLGAQYARRLRKSVWAALAVLVVLGAAAGTFSVMKVYELNQKDDSQGQYDQYSDNQTGSDSSGPDSASNATGTTKSDLESVKVDLSYYASQNGNKYPTKAQWDEPSWKTRYILSDKATVDKITYTPAGCETNGCASYTLSMTDEKGETVSLTS